MEQRRRTADAPTQELAAQLRLSIGLLVRRLREAPGGAGLTAPETSALARLERGGPATPSALARLEQITPQSMGATLAALEARRLIRRGHDPADGRQVVLRLTEAGRRALRERRNARVEKLAAALSQEFTRTELEQLAAAAPLLERLAQSI